MAAEITKNQDPVANIFSEKDRRKHYRQNMVQNQTRMYGGLLFMLLIGHILRHFQLQGRVEEIISAPASMDWSTYLISLATVILSCWIAVERVRGMRFTVLINILAYGFVLHTELSAGTLLEFLLVKPNVIVAQLGFLVLSPGTYVNAAAILCNAILSSCLFWQLAAPDVEVDEARRWIGRECAIACSMIVINCVLSERKTSALNAELAQSAYHVAVRSLRWLLKHSYDCIIELDEKFMLISGEGELELLLFRTAGSLRRTLFFDVLACPEAVSHVQQHFANAAKLNHPLHTRLRDSEGRKVEVEMFCALKWFLQKPYYVVAVREDQEPWRGHDGSPIEAHPADVAAFPRSSQAVAATAGNASAPRPDLLGTPADPQQESLPRTPSDETARTPSASTSLVVHSAHDITPRATERRALLATIQRWNVRSEYVRCCSYHAKLHEASIRLRELQQDDCWHHGDDLQLRQCQVCWTVLPFYDRICMTCRLIGRELT